MTKQINNKILYIILIFISLILIVAFFIEYQLGHRPCKLCLYQRVPYFLSILLILKILFINGFDKLALLLLSLVFIFSSTIAFYHFGIEQGFFSESLLCKAENISETLSKEELLKELKQSNVNCKDVSFTIFGLSLAAINTIFSVILSIMFIRFFLNYKKTST